MLIYVGTDAAGGRSILLSRRGKTGWAAPKALALGGGFARPFALGLSPDGTTLYFTAKKGDAKIPM